MPGNAAGIKGDCPPPTRMPSTGTGRILRRVAWHSEGSEGSQETTRPAQPHAGAADSDGSREAPRKRRRRWNQVAPGLPAGCVASSSPFPAVRTGAYNHRRGPLSGCACHRGPPPPPPDQGEKEQFSPAVPFRPPPPPPSPTYETF